MKKIKKIKITNFKINEASEIKPFYNKDEEEVLKLNLGKYKVKKFDNNNKNNSNIEEKDSKKNNPITFLKSLSKRTIKRLSISQEIKNNSYFLENIEEEFSSLNDISKSIHKLQTIVPNLLEKISTDNSRQILSAPRFQHLNYETYLHKLLKELKNQEEIIRKKKENLENEFKEIDESISDKELSIDILVNMDSFKKMFNQKMIQHYENEFRKKEESLQLSSMDNTNTNNNIDSTININNNNNFNTINNNNSTIPSFINKKINNLNKKEKDQNIKSLKMQQLLRAKTFRAKLNNYILKNKEKTNKKAEILENEVNEQKINKK